MFRTSGARDDLQCTSFLYCDQGSMKKDVNISDQLNIEKSLHYI